eukprot:TRINITY_DN4400_c0_g1_i3.p1 TRINITY_DN4400_c0_g1~~TRINITY_DN4400_c0_g1_i3.p1  ORF type:complete len:144 (+),score=9.05 TRINITY_DN4400_c0_g1_i3:52-483(+)
MQRLLQASERLGALVKTISKGENLGAKVIPTLEWKEALNAMETITWDDILPGKDHKKLFKNYVHYVNLFADLDRTVCVFGLPSNSSFPPHDHPNMLVITKILKGRLRRRSYDLIDPSKQLELQRIFYSTQIPKREDIKRLSYP